MGKNRGLEVSTCLVSLTVAGQCCIDQCADAATTAVLDEDFVEHARCDQHANTGIARKLLSWDPVWSPS